MDLQGKACIWGRPVPRDNKPEEQQAMSAWVNCDAWMTEGDITTVRFKSRFEFPRIYKPTLAPYIKFVSSDGTLEALIQIDDWFLLKSDIVRAPVMADEKPRADHGPAI